MRRTQANQTAFTWPDQPRLLETTTCHHCSVPGVTIVVMGRNENGAIEVGFCDFPHAKLHGWPWLVNIEKPKLQRGVT